MIAGETVVLDPEPACQYLLGPVLSSYYAKYVFLFYSDNIVLLLGIFYQQSRVIWATDLQQVPQLKLNCFLDFWKVKWPPPCYYLISNLFP